MSKFFSVVLAVLMMAVCFTGVFAAVEVRAPEVPGYTTYEVPTDVISYDDPMVMNYIQQFANLTTVPHPSYNTEKMTDYMLAFAEVHGLKAERDDYGNVVMWLPATEGYEDAPVVSIQGHFDMVRATDEGVEHDWENDPLDLVWTENSVKANGTSLGADNGSGLAYMMTYIDYADELVHGPITFVFSTDEEVGLLGAHALPAEYVSDVDYMINVDGGYGGAVIACAGGAYFDFTLTPEWVAVPEGNVAYTIEFKDLQGGHSAGVGNGKANGLVAAANAVLLLDQNDVEFAIASFEGGSASNAIPKNAKVVVTVKAEDVDTVTALLDDFAKKFKNSYEAVETDYSFTYGVSNDAVEKVLTADQSVAMVQLMSTIPNNIHTLLATASGTEASSNLGELRFTEDEIYMRAFMRSSSTYQAQQITMINKAIAEMTGFTLNIPTLIATWPLKAENKLADFAAELFQEMTGEEYALRAIHAGVESGEYAEKNENMAIISTGVSGGSEGHTTAESMNFDKVGVSMEFLNALVEKLAKEG